MEMPSNIRKNARKSDLSVALVLSVYAASLLRVGAEKYVENVDNMDDAPFEVKSRERDTFLADALHTADYDVKAAAALIATRMKGCDKTVVAKTIDTLCYGVLKTSMFTAWLNYNQAMARREGAVPDSFFERYNRAPAAENCEVDQNDVKEFPADQREEAQTAPPGLDTEDDVLKTINGVRFEVEDMDALAPAIAQGLEDARIHLENIRIAYGYKGHDRIPFFVEQIGGEWVRHTGSPYEAILAFEKKMDASAKRKFAAAEAVFRRHNAEALAAA